MASSPHGGLQYIDVSGQIVQNVTVVAVSGRDASVTGTIANLVAGQTADVTFDLGENWQTYREVQIFGFEDGGDLGNPQVFFQDSLSIDNSRPAWNIYGGEPVAGFYNLRSAAGGIFRIAGRFCRVNITSGTTVRNGAPATTLGPDAKVTFSLTN